MKMWTLQNRRSFLKTVGAGLGMGLAGPSGTLAAPAGLRAGESSATVRYRWVSVREIHGDGTHNAWPDICRWRGRYYVAFNSGGKNHGGGHGLSVLSSADGLNWETVLHKPAGEWGILEDTTRTTMCPKFLPLKDRLILVFYFYTAGDMNCQLATKGGSQTPLARPEGIGGKLSTVGRPPQYVLPHRGQLQRGRPQLPGSRIVAGSGVAGLAAPDLPGTPLHYRLPLPRAGVGLFAGAGEHDSESRHLRDVRERLVVQFGGRFGLEQGSAILPPRTTTRPTSISPRMAASWQ